MNKKDLTPETMIGLMEEYHPGNLKKAQRKYKRLIKKINKNMTRAAKRGNFSYEHFIPLHWLTIKDIDYTEDCVEKVKSHYINKGFLVNISITEKIFLDVDGWPNSTKGKVIKISW